MKEQTVAHEKLVHVLLRTLLSLALLGGAVGLLLFLGTPEASKRRNGRLYETPTIETVHAVPHHGGIDFSVDGEVRAFREVIVSPEVSGRVVYKSPNCRQGRFVKKGECLFRINPENYELDKRRLEAALEQAKATVEECKVEIRNLVEQIALSKEQLAIQKRELERYESVNDPGVYSKSEIDMAKNSVLSAKYALQQLESQCRLKKVSKERLETVCKSAKSQLDEAELGLKRTEVFAPISGIVTNYNVEQDSYLQTGASAVTIQDTSRLEIRCNLYMHQVAWLWQTEKAKQAKEKSSPKDDPQVPEGPNAPKDPLQAYRLPDVDVKVRYRLDNTYWVWSGKLTSYDGSSVDLNTRMMPCRVTVNDPLTAEPAKEGGKPSLYQSAPPSLLAGMYVKVEIHSEPEIPLLQIPEQALIPGDHVWTANKGILKRHQVQVAQIEKGGVVIYADSEGIQKGDVVVVSPPATPIDGMKVKLKDPSPTPSTPKTTPVVDDDDKANKKL